jgi:imidazolonepropionase-like amidohydrolase
MELLVTTGLSPYEFLKTATVTPQEFLEKTLGKRRGLVAAGFDAGLRLVEGNPLTDVATTRHVLAFMLRDKWDPAERHGVE